MEIAIWAVLIVSLFFGVGSIVRLPFRRWLSSQVARNTLKPYVRAKDVWVANDFNSFLEHCDYSRLNMLLKSLRTKESSQVSESQSAEIKKELLWHSSHMCSYQFKDPKYID